MTTTTSTPTIRVGNSDVPIRALTTADRIAFERWLQKSVLTITAAVAGKLSVNELADLATHLQCIGWYSEPCIRAAGTQAGQVYLLWLATRDSHDLTPEQFEATLTDDQRAAGEQVLAALTWPEQEQKGGAA